MADPLKLLAVFPHPDDESLDKFLGEGTFLRAFSLVNGGRVVERDLFEGLR